MTEIADRLMPYLSIVFFLQNPGCFDSLVHLEAILNSVNPKDQNLPKNPYFEPFLLPNHPLLGLATFRKVDSLMKMSNFSFTKFSQKLGV